MPTIKEDPIPEPMPTIKEEPITVPVPEPVPAEQESSDEEPIIHPTTGDDRKKSALKSLLSIIGRPVSIKGHIGKYLECGAGNKVWFGNNHVGMNEQWLIFPVDNGQVII